MRFAFARFAGSLSLFGLIAAVSALAGNAQAPARDSIIVSAKWLAAHAGDPTLVVLDVEDRPADAFRGRQIPGAVYLAFNDIFVKRDSNAMELPDPSALEEILSRAGMSNSSRVVVYSANPMVAARTFFTLDYSGVDHVSVLDGGAAAWQAAGFRLGAGVDSVKRGHFVVRPRPGSVANADWIMAHAKSSHVRLIDTRTDAEYVGGGMRHDEISDGRLPGARRLEWEELLRDAGGAAVFKDPSALAALYATRAAPGDTIVTYCAVGYRASMTYLVGRYLGYPTMLYDGSFQDWARRKLPVVSGDRP